MRVRRDKDVSDGGDRVTKMRGQRLRKKENDKGPIQLKRNHILGGWRFTIDAMMRDEGEQTGVDAERKKVLCFVLIAKRFLYDLVSGTFSMAVQ